jgi:hypothetical protein
MLKGGSLGSFRCNTGCYEHGALAQLGERLHGMQEVDGSIPSGSTNNLNVRSYAKPYGSN